MFELLQPGLLWLGALAVPLVALYLLKARRRRQVVPAVWLWQEAQADLEARVPLRRLRRDYLLWLELLILALLALAAAGPFRRALAGTRGDTAVVVDASASMTADGTAAELDAALRRLVDGIGPGDRTALVRAGVRPEVLVPLQGDRRALLAALERAAPGAAAAELGPAVELAKSLLGDDGDVVVLTDAAGVVPAGTGARVLRVGPEASTNVGIVALGVRASDSSGSEHQVFVRLRSSAAEPSSGTLRLRVGGRLRDAARLELPAGGEASRTLSLSGVRAAADGTVLEVEWQGERDDALASDDRAYWVLRPPSERRYFLSAAADPYLRRALAVQRADGWRQVTEGSPAELEIVLGSSPDDEGPPFLWIDPPATSYADGATVLSWDRTHPALRFLDLRSLRLGRVPRLERAPGARALATSTAGPLFLEGRHRGRSYLLWAFDPMATDLPLRVAFPLLVRHALEHLAPAAGPLDGGLGTGAPPPLPWPVAREAEEAEPVKLVSPTGAELPIPSQGGVLHLPPLEEVGVYRLTGGGRDVRFGTGLLDEGESDLGRAPEARPAAESVTVLGLREKPRETLRGLWRPLAFLALVLLLVEGMAFHRRWTL